MSGIPIFLASDNNYVSNLAVTITSIVANTKEFLNFYILDSGISAKNREKLNKLKRKYNNLTIEFLKINFSDELSSIKYKNDCVHVNISTYSRFLIPKLKPDLEKVLYLDCDIVVNKDIKELYDCELDDYLIAAVPENFGDYNLAYKNNVRLGLSKNHRYFNAGVLLFNNKKFVENNIFDLLLKTEIKCRKKLKLADQDILNIVFDNKYKVLDEKYNWMSQKDFSNPNVVVRHYNTDTKPWNYTPLIDISIVPDVSLYWKYLKLTPFYKDNFNRVNDIKVQKDLLYRAKIKKLLKSKKLNHKISVIIPVYNVEKYLKRCLDSVINQTYKNLEIICINDASNDNSKCILEQYSKKDIRIKLFDNAKNVGVSAVRNMGLRIASGEYIYFLDSDDWIEPDYIEIMLGTALLSKSKVVLNTQILAHKSGIPNSQFMEFFTKNYIQDCFVPANRCVMNIIWNVWAYLWKKSFLDEINVCFPEGYISEDIYFQAVTLANIDTICVIRQSAYHYTVRDNSLTSKLKQTKLSDFSSQLKICQKISEFFENKGELENVAIKLFYIWKYEIDSSEYRAFLKELKVYFEKIKPNVIKHKNLYNNDEMTFFNEVLDDIEKVAVDFKTRVLSQLRQRVKNDILKKENKNFLLINI